MQTHELTMLAENTPARSDVQTEQSVEKVLNPSFRLKPIVALTLEPLARRQLNAEKWVFHKRLWKFYRRFPKKIQKGVGNAFLEIFQKLYGIISI